MAWHWQNKTVVHTNVEYRSVVSLAPIRYLAYPNASETGVRRMPICGIVLHIRLPL